MKLYYLLFLVFISSAFSQPEIPKLKMWATDLTNTLSQSELQNLNTRLKSYQDTTSNQIVILMISSLENYPIEMLAEEIASKNKIGTEKNDNGILLLIAKDDRELRIEVGYGLEGAVPDAIASSIIRNVIRPRFKDNDYYLGINEGINSIIAAIGGEYKAEDAVDDDNGGFSLMFLIVIIIIAFTFMRGGGPFVPGGIYRTGTHSRGWSSGSSGWGGSSGGGFSGGGGSFGGGGASGSW